MPKRESSKWLALVTVSTGTLMGALNTSIVNIANPVLAAQFDVSMAQIQWVATVYLIINSSLMLLFGRLGDRVGSHKVFIVGVAIFTAGSLSCALVNELALLLLARALQGVGASMMISVGIGLVTTIFPLEQRGSAMGITVLMVGLGNIVGPTIGGFVLAHTSWHYIFLLSVPFGLATFIMAALWLRSPLPQNNHTSLDIKGAILFTATVGSLIVFLSGGFVGQEWFGLIFVVFLTGFIVIERREEHPLLELSLFKNKRFILGNVLAILIYSSYTMLSFQFPFFLDTVWGIPVEMVGLLLMIAALMLAVGGPTSGFIADRIGAFKAMFPALIVLTSAVALSFFLAVEESLWLFIIILFLCGAGMGFFNTPNNSDIMTAAGREHASYASGFVGTNRNLGFSLGTALSAGVFSLGATLHSNFPEILGALSKDAAEAYVQSFTIVLILCLMLLLVSLGILVYLMRDAKLFHRPGAKENEKE